MKIMIIGWYGTETIGDRAILAGLFYLFSKSWGKLEIKLGCLETLLTERTMDEDSDFFKKCSNDQIMNISLFDSRKKKDLDHAIEWADIIVVGGGPLMEINPMYMLLYAFKKAKKMHKKSIVAGCGMGPFLTERLKRCAIDIIDASDLAIFRDGKSREIYHSCSQSNSNIYDSIDPAVFAATCFKKQNVADDEVGSYVAINFREPPAFEYKGLGSVDDEFFSNILLKIAEMTNMPIRLVPMHTYWIGGDDRYILNRICRKTKLQEVSVYNKPLSLEETMRVYANSSYCVGMRFHAVLLQTFLNGNNIILDYTDPQKGKIINLLNQLRIKDAYIGRYISLVNNPSVEIEDIRSLKEVDIPDNVIGKFEETYINNLCNLVYS